MSIAGFSQTATNAAIAPLLKARCHVLTRSETPDGEGGQDVVYTRGPEVRCAVGPLGGGEGANNPGDRIDDRTTDVLTLPAGTEITERDQIEVVGGDRFEATAVRRRTVEIAREVEVIVAGSNVQIVEGEP